MISRVVIDSNRLQSPELQEFLEASASNYAVLTDYAWMEAYKGKSVISIQKSMAILTNFPKQVILLRGTKDISALDPSAPGLSLRMQWPRKEGDFTNTVVGLKKAAEQHFPTLRMISAHGRAADRQMEILLADALSIPDTFTHMMRSLLSKEDIDSIRARRPHSRSMIQKFLDMSEYVAQRMYERHPKKPKKPTYRAKYDSFIYRFCVGCVLYFLDWVRQGGQINKAPAKLRNDMIDINFATYGTFFNGVMSNDKRVCDLYDEMVIVLKAVGARIYDRFDNDRVRNCAR